MCMYVCTMSYIHILISVHWTSSWLPDTSYFKRVLGGRNLLYVCCRTHRFTHTTTGNTIDPVGSTTGSTVFVGG